MLQSRSYGLNSRNEEIKLLCLVVFKISRVASFNEDHRDFPYSQLHSSTNRRHSFTDCRTTFQHPSRPSNSYKVLITFVLALHRLHFSLPPFIHPISTLAFFDPNTHPNIHPHQNKQPIININGDRNSYGRHPSGISLGKSKKMASQTTISCTKYCHDDFGGLEVDEDGNLVFPGNLTKWLRQILSDAGRNGLEDQLDLFHCNRFLD